MPTEAVYTIADLARLSGLNVRTIRYYLAQGLIPASGESGPGAHYGEGHLDRLRLTKRLQAQHLPLAEIRLRLAELSDEDVAGLIAAETEAPTSPTTSALDYIRNVLGTPDDLRGQQQSLPTSASASAYRSTAGPAPMAPTPNAAPTAPRMSGGPASGPSSVPLTPTRRLLAAARLRMPAMDIANRMDPIEADSAHLNLAESDPAYPAYPAQAMPRMRDEPQSLERSQWERLSLGPNIELHIRRPLSRLEQRRVERLITIARQVLHEDQS